MAVVHGRSVCGIDALRIVRRVGHVLALGESTSSASGPWSRSAASCRSPPPSGVVVPASSPSPPPHAASPATIARGARPTRRPGDRRCRTSAGDATGRLSVCGRRPTRRPARAAARTRGVGHDRVVAGVDSERLGAGDPLEQLRLTPQRHHLIAHRDHERRSARRRRAIQSDDENSPIARPASSTIRQSWRDACSIAQSLHVSLLRCR